MNKPNLVPQVPVRDIFELIPEHLTENCSVKDINELKSSFVNKFCRKRIYKFAPQNSEALLLTLGHTLGPAYKRSVSFFSKVPLHACKPIFLNSESEYDLYAQEFFEGIPLDQLLNESKVSECEVNRIISDIQSELQKLETPSSVFAMRTELDDFAEKVLSNPTLDALDRKIISKDILPCIQNFIVKTNPRLRWSPGDLIARNISVNNELNYKIIDFEFAHETHFHCEDWIRLGSYGKESFISLELVKLIKENIPFPLHIYHLLRQTLLNRDIHYGKDYNHHLQFDLVQILKQSSNKNIISSQIFKGFTKDLANFENSCSKYKEKNICLEKTKEELIQFNEKQATEKSNLISLNS